MSEFDFKNIILPVYIINIIERPERFNHIINEFKNRFEFEINIIQSHKHIKGNVGLWNNIKECVRQAIEKEEDLIIICEDDHIFTNDYNKDDFIREILYSHAQGAKVILGGVSGFKHAVPISRTRYWVNSFWGTQFVVVFSSLFQEILNYPFADNDAADAVFSEMTSHKMVLYPFISVQKYFGYSDVTRNNDIFKNLVDDYFNEAKSRMDIYKSIYEKYCLE
ncbi:hypothetical protein [Elizabethkingia anophelis]|uniref:hypothetical protein n=1 Tax=Elizabethkingia anophelis TaxID=1117645 RepID=UPI003891353E